MELLDHIYRSSRPLTDIVEALDLAMRETFESCAGETNKIKANEVEGLYAHACYMQRFFEMQSRRYTDDLVAWVRDRWKESTFQRMSELDPVFKK